MRVIRPLPLQHPLLKTSLGAGEQEKADKRSLTMQSKIANVFAALVAIFTGLVTLFAFVCTGIFIVQYLGLWNPIQAIKTPQVSWFCTVIGAGFWMMTGLILSIWFANSTGDRVECRLQEAASKRAETLRPILYRCDNNGVAVLITAEQREKAFQKMLAASGNIMLVPDAMVFTANDHFYPMRLDVIRTGNWVDMKNLIEGCNVKPDSIHVNFSSFNMVDKEYQWYNFCPPKLDDAIRWVEREKLRLAKVAWLRRNTFCVAITGFALTILAFGAGMLATLTMTKTVLFVCSGGSLATALWAVRRLNSPR